MRRQTNFDQYLEKQLKDLDFEEVSIKELKKNAPELIKAGKEISEAMGIKGISLY